MIGMCVYMCYTYVYVKIKKVSFIKKNYYYNRPSVDLYFKSSDKQTNEQNKTTCISKRPSFYAFYVE